MTEIKERFKINLGPIADGVQVTSFVLSSEQKEIITMITKWLEEKRLDLEIHVKQEKGPELGPDLAAVIEVASKK